ncbi:hypothetical protein M8C21_012214 [Ambrosia artemisiifolia]|uniref:Uncharacterized protein n=1 Tax=Ambrosia artemisiifolia TaxID=4212 RepID=A0AAD5CKA6_AMBAR|nr:hypothetical protein M8C21_012214 [Ambrosia artemisiifolia]
MLRASDLSTKGLDLLKRLVLDAIPLLIGNNGGQWNSRGKCNNEVVKPIKNKTYLSPYPDKMVLEWFYEVISSFVIPCLEEVVITVRSPLNAEQKICSLEALVKFGMEDEDQDSSNEKWAFSAKDFFRRYASLDS